MLRLIKGTNPEILRKYGFKQGKEFFGVERRFGENGYGYQGYAEDWFKFAMDEEEPDRIAYIEECCDIPMVEIHCCKRNDNIWIFYIDCAPSCTYHIGGSELNIITDTLYDLFAAGLIEKAEC